jgi:hypothetical protein
MKAFWVIASFSLIEVYSHISGAYCLHHQGHDLIREAVCTSEMLVYLNLTTWRYISEGSHLQTCRHENLKAHEV